MFAWLIMNWQVGCSNECVPKMYLSCCYYGLQAVKDWHLFLGCAVMVGIITTAVVLSFVVPVFKPNPMLVEDQEMPPRTDVSKKNESRHSGSRQSYVCSK